MLWWLLKMLWWTFVWAGYLPCSATPAAGPFGTAGCGRARGAAWLGADLRVYAFESRPRRPRDPQGIAGRERAGRAAWLGVVTRMSTWRSDRLLSILPWYRRSRSMVPNVLFGIGASRFWIRRLRESYSGCWALGARENHSVEPVAPSIKADGEENRQ